MFNYPKPPKYVIVKNHRTGEYSIKKRWIFGITTFVRIGMNEESIWHTTDLATVHEAVGYLNITHRLTKDKYTEISP